MKIKHFTATRHVPQPEPFYNYAKTPKSMIY